MLTLAAAAPLRAETLADAIGAAYRSNPTIESGRYDVFAADEDLVQARSELRPTLDLDVEGQYVRTVSGRARRLDNPFVSRINDSDTARAQVTAVQPLYTGGRATADQRIAEADIGAGREALRRAEGDLLLGVITAYVDVRRFAATLEVWRTSVAELTRLGEEIVARQEAGELTRTDIAQANRQIAEAKQQFTLTEQAFEGARGDYAALVGRDAGALAPEPALPQMPQDVATAFELAENSSPELTQARYVEHGSRATITAARSQGMPTISLRGTATLSGEALPYKLRDQDQEYAGSVVMRLPLSAGGRIASQIRQAEYRNGSDRLRIEATRREVVRRVNDAWNQVVTAGRSMNLLDEQRRAAVIQLEGSIAEYRLGLRSTFDVLYAQQTLRDTEVALLASRRDRYVAEASLLRRTGLLEAAALMTGIELHDPADHLRSVENDNALPWDGFARALDRAGTPKVRQRTLRQPGIAPASPAIVPEAAALREDAPLSRSLPNTPVPGTVGHPATSREPETRRWK